MSTAKLEIWPAVGKNFRSLGESFYSSIIRYPWMLAIGAFAGYLLGKVRMYGSQNAMNMYSMEDLMAKAKEMYTFVSHRD